MRSSLSQSQLGVYYACVTNNDEFTNYQNPVLLEIPNDANAEQVRKAVYETLCAHPYRASRIVLGENGVPEVENGEFPSMEETVPLIPVGSIEEVKSGFARTMDIYGERLYRCELYQTAEGKAWLYLDFHHVIADGFSMVLILRDIERCFNGNKPVIEEIDGNTIAREEEYLRADEGKMSEAREWYGKTFCDAAETDSLPIPENTLGDAPAEMCGPLVGIEDPPQCNDDGDMRQLVDHECDCTAAEPLDLDDVDEEMGYENHQRNDPSAPVGK